MSLSKIVLRIVSLSLIFFAAKNASASPWVLPKGKLVISGGFDFQYADSEFLDSGPERSFPLRGKFLGATFNLATRIGLTENFEVAASIPLKLVSYGSDPVILSPAPAQLSGEQALNYYQNNLIDFSQSGAGVGDIQIAGRYALLRQPIALALQVGIKAPTGYEPPQGTFGREPETVEEFDRQKGELVNPENIEDDVSLGGAQMDLDAQLLMGVAFSSGLFARLGAGYKIRLGGAGDQIVADVKVGQRIAKKLLLYAGAQFAYSIEEGKSIGVTVSAVDPDLGAASFIQGNNTRAYVRRLQYDALDVGGGLIWRMTKEVELNFNYSRIVWGSFIAANNTGSVTMIWHTDLGD